MSLLCLSYGDQHRAALVVDAELGVVVADALDRLARDLDVVDVGVGRDLAGQYHEAGVDQGLGSDARAQVLRQMASRMASEIWSATLSGWPSEPIRT